MRYAPAATISALEQKLHTLHGRLFTSGDWLGPDWTLARFCAAARPLAESPDTCRPS